MAEPNQPTSAPISQVPPKVEVAGAPKIIQVLTPEQQAAMAKVKETTRTGLVANNTGMLTDAANNLRNAVAPAALLVLTGVANPTNAQSPSAPQATIAVQENSDPRKDFDMFLIARKLDRRFGPRFVTLNERFPGGQALILKYFQVGKSKISDNLKPEEKEAREKALGIWIAQYIIYLSYVKGVDDTLKYFDDNGKLPDVELNTWNLFEPAMLVVAGYPEAAAVTGISPEECQKKDAKLLDCYNKKLEWIMAKVAQLRAENAQLRAENAQADARIAELDKQIAALKKLLGR